MLTSRARFSDACGNLVAPSPASARHQAPSSDGAVEWNRATDLLITNQLFNFKPFDCGLSRAIEQFWP